MLNVNTEQHFSYFHENLLFGFSELRWELIIRFVEIGTIAYCLNVRFLNL
jgi:hypothetical protein